MAENSLLILRFSFRDVYISTSLNLHISSMFNFTSRDVALYLPFSHKRSPREIASPISAASGPLRTSLARCHSPRISSRIFPWTRFTRLIFRRAFRAPSPTVSGLALVEASRRPSPSRAQSHTSSYFTSETARDATRSRKRSLFRRGKKKGNSRDQPRVYFVADGAESGRFTERGGPADA